MFSPWQLGQDDAEVLYLKSLSPDQPFDLTGSITTHSEPPSTESITTANSLSMDLDNKEEEECDEWSGEKPVPVYHKSLSWDNFNSSSFRHQPTKTPFLTEAPFDCFESILETTGYITVKEGPLVISLIQAILGLPSIYFTWDSRLKCFKSVRQLRISGVTAPSIQPIIDSILTFGSHMKAIEYVAKQCQLNPRQYGSTGVAFACCLLELLFNIQSSLIQLFDTLKDDLSILKVHQYVASLSVLCERLYRLCKINVVEESIVNAKPYDFHIPFGAELLNLLYTEIQLFDLAHAGTSAFYRNVCLMMLCYTNLPYLNILSKWLGLESSGNVTLEDPYQEFFICKAPEPCEPFEEYQIRPDTIFPYFINVDLAIHILRSGITLQLLRQAMPDHPLCYMDRRLPLRCRLRISDTSSYLQQIQHVCQRIREYNSGKNQGCIIDQKESVQDTVHIEDTTNPFHLPPWSEDRFEGEFLRNLKQFLELTNNNSSDIIPTSSTFVVLNYTEPIQAWCPMLNESYMSTFLHEFKLQYHLSLLHDTFLLGNSAFVSSLESMVFESTRKIGLKSTGKWSSQLFDLNLALRSILLETVKEDELFAFSVEKAKVLVDPNAFNAFGFLKLHYDARYPLNMVITSNVQLKYNRIFIFLLQLFRVTSTVKRIYSVLRTNELRLNGDTLSRLYQYRFQFDQFLRSLQGYVHDTVINETWHIFMDQIQELNRKTESSSSEYVSVIMQPHMFKSYHEHILDRILYQCFLKQSQQRIFQTLQPILEDMLMFANVIDSYCYSRNQQEDKLLTKCHHIFKDFQRHVRLLVCVLKVLEEKGTGRLGNILNSTNNEFRDLYGKHEAKKGLDVFVKDLLTRIDLNMYYEKSK